MPTVAEIAALLEQQYPPRLAEEWDRIGLVCGDPQQPVRRALFTVDVVAETVTEAIENGADLIIAHHPLLLRGVHTVATTTAKGRLLTQLIRHNIAVFVAHTNADAARPGVSDALAARIGLAELRPLRPASAEPLDKLVTFVPEAETTRVLDAITAAGGASFGEYARCAWLTSGTGTFVPGVGAHPAVGERGEVVEVAEHRLETIHHRAQRGRVLAAMRGAHSYEEPAFDVIELAGVDSDEGLGRVGRLPEPVPLRDFVRQVANALPTTVAGVRAAGDPARPVAMVAVVGGAGDSLLGDAQRAGVDAYVTADLRHHPVSEQLADGGPVLIDAGHWGTERPWLDQAAAVLTRELGQVTVYVSDIVTDPWTCQAHNLGENANLDA